MATISSKELIIVGFTGPISSGKDVLADKLKEDGWHYISLSHLVREEAKRREIEETRENLIAIGNDLREKKGPGVLAELAVKKVNELGLEKYIINGIRNPGEVEVLKKQNNFFLVGVDAPSLTRYERAMARARESDPKALEELKAVDKKDIEIGIYDCMAQADVVIYNLNKTIEDLCKELDEFMYQKDLKVKPIERPKTDEYYWGVALSVGQRGTCLRRRFGAIIVKNNQIISTGYVGAPRGTPNCIDLKKCYRKEKGIKPGTQYDLCRSVHAEENAIIHAPRSEMIGTTMYIAGQNLEKGDHPVIKAHPCEMCRRKIINAGIELVITKDADGNFNRYHVSDWIEEAKVDPYIHLDKPGYNAK